MSLSDPLSLSELRSFDEIEQILRSNGVKLDRLGQNGPDGDKPWQWSATVSNLRRGVGEWRWGSAYASTPLAAIEGALIDYKRDRTIPPRRSTSLPLPDISLEDLEL